jgi:hypothetical protein
VNRDSVWSGLRFQNHICDYTKIDEVTGAVI